MLHLMKRYICNGCDKYFLYNPANEPPTKLCYHCKTPKILDFKNIRELRQKETNQKIIHNILNDNPIDDYINPIEFGRVIDELSSVGLKQEDIIIKCKNDNVFATVFAGRIAKKTSRQGSNDEKLQIDVCNQLAVNFGINIENLSATAFRPTKDGNILSECEYKSCNIRKDMCLKSFDAKISGKIDGWVFAKVVYGKGGHQDNVFEEADILCDWITKYRKNEIYVILIDTDLLQKFDALKTKYANNEGLLIMNHTDFQQYIIDNYQ